jgi:hypothetical protein
MGIHRHRPCPDRDLIEPGIAVADFVLIPTPGRPHSTSNRAAITVELCETHNKPRAFVLNHAMPGATSELHINLSRLQDAV